MLGSSEQAEPLKTTTHTPAQMITILEAVRFLVKGGLSVPQACALMQRPRSTFLDAAKPEDDTALLAQIRELADGTPAHLRSNSRVTGRARP